ncbi:MAG: hypothetical protein AB7U82_27910 [Blastocatellales bacterium]
MRIVHAPAPIREDGNQLCERCGEVLHQINPNIFPENTLANLTQSAISPDVEAAVKPLMPFDKGATLPEGFERCAAADAKKGAKK